MLEAIWALAVRRPVELLGALLILLALLVAQGCGASQAEQHRTLNMITDTVQPSYDLAVSTCDEAEGAILARAGSTAEEDRSAILEVRSVCDRIFGGFEAVRLAELSARGAVDDGAQGAITAALATLDEAWQALQLLIPELEQLGRSAQ